MFLSLALLVAPVAGEIPEGLPQDPGRLARHLSRMLGDGLYLEFDGIWDQLSDEEKAAVDEIWKQMEREAQERDRRRDAQLRELAGDEWEAHMAAFFTSTLFDTETGFDAAYVGNLQVLEQVTAKSEEELAREAQHAEWDERAAADVARNKARKIGRDLRETYGEAAGELTGVRFHDFQTETFHKMAGLMMQDAHMGQILQVRYQVNLLKIGDGQAAQGNFASMSPAEVLQQVVAINREIGNLRLADEDDPKIAELQAQRAELLALPGVADSEAAQALRANAIAALIPLAHNVSNAKAAWEDTETRHRQYDEAAALLRLIKSQPPPGSNEAAWDAWLAEQARLEAILADPVTRADVTAARTAYYQALDQSPFLNAQITLGDFEGPFWQFLTYGHSPEENEAAFDLAIDFIDQATLEVMDQYGTIVEVTPLIETYGSPAFGALRQQLATDLQYTGLENYFPALESLYQVHWADTELSRTMFDAGIGLAQIVIGGIIFLFPVTAPVLVPVELGLMTIQLGVEGGRFYIASQELTAAEQLAQSGAGSHVALGEYTDMMDARAGSFILVLGTAPLQVAGSAGALSAARQMKSAGTGRAAAALDDGSDAAAAGARTADDVDSAAAATAASAASRVDDAGMDFATFQAMSPEEQAAALATMSEAGKGRLVGQLSRADQNALAAALGRSELGGQLTAMMDMKNGLWYRTTAQGHLGLTDEGELLIVGEDFVPLIDDFPVDDLARGQFTNPLTGELEPIILDIPRKGFYTENMTQAQIDALFARTGPLTQEEILQKADLIYSGRAPNAGIDAETRAILREEMRNHIIHTVNKGPLTMEQEMRLANAFGGDPPPVTASAPAVSAPPPFIANPGWSDPRVPVGGLPRWLRGMGAGDDVLPPSFLQAPTPAPPPGAAGMSDIATGAATDLGPVAPVVRQPANAGAVDPNISDIPTDMVNPGARAAAEGTQSAPAAGAADPAISDIPTSMGTGNAASTPLDSTTTMSRPGIIVHLEPGAFDGVPPSRWPLWMNFGLKGFYVGNCLGETSADCPEVPRAVILSVPAERTDEISGLLQDSPEVAWAGPDSDRLRQGTPNDPLYGSRGSWNQAYDDQWAIKRVGFTAGPDSAWSLVPRNPRPVVVAVIDTGVAWNHRDLDAGQMWTNADEIPGNRIDDDRNGYVDDILGWNFLDETNLPWDFDGHGTLVASLIAARSDNGVGIAGINPGARIMALKALDNSGRGRASSVAEAIVYAAANGARVINLSVGGLDLTPTEQAAIDYARSTGVVVVAAAGNEGISLDGYGPAGADNVLTVAATGIDDRPVLANQGRQVDLAAPGVDVLGLRAIATDLMGHGLDIEYAAGGNIVGESRSYYRASGTSFAAPIVAGVASLLLSSRPDLTDLEVERLLEQSADDIAVPGFDHYTGYGMLDAVAALRGDPDFYIHSRIDGVGAVRSEGKLFVEVYGTSAADRLGASWIELGPGTNPETWVQATESSDRPVTDGLLGAIDASLLRGHALWTLRLVTEHADGRAREARYELKLE